MADKENRPLDPLELLRRNQEELSRLLQAQTERLNRSEGSGLQPLTEEQMDALGLTPHDWSP